jgi:hypothetical protein
MLDLHRSGAGAHYSRAHRVLLCIAKDRRDNSAWVEMRGWVDAVRDAIWWSPASKSFVPSCGSGPGKTPEHVTLRRIRNNNMPETHGMHIHQPCPADGPLLTRYVIARGRPMYSKSTTQAPKATPHATPAPTPHPRSSLLLSLSLVNKADEPALNQVALPHPYQQPGAESTVAANPSVDEATIEATAKHI